MRYGKEDIIKKSSQFHDIMNFTTFYLFPDVLQHLE